VLVQPYLSAGAKMKAVALAFGVAGVTLFGCGSGGGPSPTPGYNPTSVADAWANHFEAFGTGDAVQIMLDYDDESVLAVFNDACTSTTGEYATYTGQEIKGFFESLFARLGSPQGVNGTLNVPAFSADGTVANPVVEPTTGLDATANVFLVWSSVGEGVGPTTDSFMWKAGYKIMKQNIVTTEASQCTTGAARVAQKRTERRLKDSAKIEAAWTNHLDSFGGQNLTTIMEDYLETSIIRVFDFNGVQYSAHTGLTEIRTMFAALFAAINAAADDDGATGVEVRQLEVEAVYNSVFLVWKSFSHPKATDTFLFDDEGKIVRQNIVVTTKTSAAAQAWV